MMSRHLTFPHLTPSYVSRWRAADVNDEISADSRMGYVGSPAAASVVAAGVPRARNLDPRAGRASWTDAGSGPAAVGAAAGLLTSAGNLDDEIRAVQHQISSLQAVLEQLKQAKQATQVELRQLQSPAAASADAGSA